MTTSVLPCFGLFSPSDVPESVGDGKMAVIGRVGCITGNLTHWDILIARIPTCCTCIFVFVVANVYCIFAILSDVP
jgi:hypothetical protein